MDPASRSLLLYSTDILYYCTVLLYCIAILYCYTVLLYCTALLYCCTAWYGSCTALDQGALQRVVKAAQRIMGGELPSLQGTFEKRCVSRAERIIKASHHPSHKLFRPCRNPRPGKRFTSVPSTTTRMLNSYFPMVVRLLNKQ